MINRYFLIFFSPLLLILSLIYGFFVSVRNFCFNCSLLKTQRLKLPVVSVGNITVGGSGKTAVVLEILKHWPSLGVLTRGYRSEVLRQNKVPALVNDSTDPLWFGDEPSLLKKKSPNTVVVIDSNRSRGALFALNSNLNIKGFILDDGYQHRYIFRDLNIVLLDVESFVKYPGLIPFGRFRESLNSLERADHILLTKWNYQDQKNIQKIVAKIQSYKKDYSFLKTQIKHAENINQQKLDLNKVILVSGLGQPLVFERDFKARYPDIEIVKLLTFQDHHNYTINDIQNILKTAQSQGCALVCTEKDFIKIQAFKLGLENFYYTVQELDLGEALTAKLHKLFKRD